MRHRAQRRQMVNRPVQPLDSTRRVVLAQIDRYDWSHAQNVCMARMYGIRGFAAYASVIRCCPAVSEVAQSRVALDRVNW